MLGILYESNEWSDWKLHRELEAALGERVAMVDMCDSAFRAQALACEMLVSRVFASSVYRGHRAALVHMDELVRNIEGSGIELVNAPRAHAFEVSKLAAYEELEARGIAVPRLQASGTPQELASRMETLRYPCVIKPDCGGRSTHTAVLRDAQQARQFLGDAPTLPFIVQDYIASRAGFMTRVELVDGNVALVVKRSIAPSGISSYHAGSTYEPYPDCASGVTDEVLKAARALSIEYGSFDVMEHASGTPFIIDANSVSNVSEDCTELFGIDLMGEYAASLAARYRKRQAGKAVECE